ncbi:f-actin capping protein beta subunit, putative [Bodo saltans]|uniref:F-actin capping protein beta subunit, putative n=1 Tax=Bodo saltans TaxID=75058 RepID=A0A0S4JT17_BODSA|nr:f-actin capping protein beta subunit, putative [Bodo saltans]|eukprot:CUG93419.1 f-actin capping protein beta subunit, putative [Bodo saltans]
MATYTRLYYAHHDLRDDTVISSCYAWAIDEAVASGCEDLTDDDGEVNSAVPAEIGVAIYILHRHRGEGAGHEDDDTETNQAAARVQNQWTSSHVASIRPSLDGSAFAFQSSVMLDIVQAQHDDDDSTSGLQKQRVHGLVATETTKFHGRSVALKASSRISPMEQLGTAAVVELCEHLQRVENALRDTLESLYIGKVGSMMAQSLRVDPQQLKSSTQQQTKTAPSSAASKALHQDPIIPQEEVSLPADSTEKKKKKSKSSTSESGASKRSAWEVALDEDGNTYYYHTETGETSWDPPAEEQEGQQLSLNAAETAPEEEQGVAPSAAPDATAEEESGAVDPLSILESLGLTQPAEGYYKELKRYLRRFYGIKVFTEESLLQMDDPEYTLGEGENGDEGELRQVLDVLIPVYGDRRKVLKWIARRRTEMEQ